jgi:hypothetical protein
MQNGLLTNIDITFYYQSDIDSGYYESSTFNLEFVDISGAFEEIEIDDCNRYNNFSLSAPISLPGFCGGIEFSIKRKPENITDPNAVNEVLLSGFSNLDLLALAPDCEDCYPLSAPHYYPNPVPCGCEEYNLEVTLTPCPTQLCPPLLGILNENVTICCSCDIRSTPPGE